jgi:hypothetical protein
MSGVTMLARLANLTPESTNGRGAYSRASTDEITMEEFGERKRDGSKSPRGGSYRRGRSIKPFLFLLAIFVVATALCFIAVR